MKNGSRMNGGLRFGRNHPLAFGGPVGLADVVHDHQHHRDHPQVVEEEEARVKGAAADGANAGAPAGDALKGCRAIKNLLRPPHAQHLSRAGRLGHTVRRGRDEKRRSGGQALLRERV